MLGANLENSLNEGIGTLNGWATTGLKQATMQSKNIQMETPATIKANPTPEEPRNFSLGQQD
jgi:hypothetical protein